ncbi:MAG: hypothetical protein J5861_04500 [Desulfovibrio sp.]|nr:hypothetical protein [Desulfovibrio sp.]
MKKRMADILEKLGVANLVIGIFKGQLLGFVVGFYAIFWCLKLTKELKQ